MRTTVSAKRCPECGKVTALHAPDCAACGHQFRTRFAEPIDRTEAFDALLLPRPPAAPVHPFPLPPRRESASSFTQAFWGAFCVVAAVGLAVWLTWGWSQQAATPLSRAARPASTVSGRAFSFTSPAGSPGPAFAGGAEDLYGRISLGMSLYDVDQTAGGMGRVVRPADPHFLRLSYDYPEPSGLTRSVRVTLSRGGSSGGDYRVQSVAVYRGQTLLHRR